MSSGPLSSALRSLHHLLVNARYLALTGQDVKSVARLLDEAEYLAALPVQGGDWVREFRRSLESLGGPFPELAGLAAEFDEDCRTVAQH